MSKAGSEVVSDTGNDRVASPGQVSTGPDGTTAAVDTVEIQDGMASGQRMIFSGPNSLRHHRVTVPVDFMSVGIGERSPEISSQMAYLTRSSPSTPFPRSRHQHVGEVGWTAEYFGSLLGKEHGGSVQLTR